jgi:Ferritin-like domain
VPRHCLSRGAFLRSGAALALAGSFAPVAAADALPDEDLAWARLLLAAELLAIDFYTRALAAKRFSRAAEATLRRALFNEREHYRAVAQILSGAGQTVTTAGDIDFSYARGAFASPGAIARTGVALERLLLGAYLGAVGSYRTAALKQPAALIAANEAQHLSVFAAERDNRPLGVSFPAPLTVDEASNALDAYTS